MRPALLALLLAGCPKPTPVEAPVPDADAPPAVIESSGAIAENAERRVTLVGALERRTATGAPAEGTAVVLDDGGAVWLSEGEPPDTWGWMVGQRVRVQGTLQLATPSGLDVPWLADPDAPMPADATMPGLAFPM